MEASRVQTVYIELLGEGVDVWRPLQAEPESPAIFRLPPTAPSGETWRFPPGSRVLCETRQLSGGPALVAVELAP